MLFRTQIMKLALTHLFTSPCVKLKVTQSCLILCNPMNYTVHEILQARILDWIDSLSLLQGISPGQGLNPSLPHCRQIIYQLSYQGSPHLVYNPLTQQQILLITSSKHVQTLSTPHSYCYHQICTNISQTLYCNSLLTSISFQ